jgi:hypothetical protein
MLAQKIALETNEDSALAVAKRFAPRDPIATTRRGRAIREAKKLGNVIIAASWIRTMAFF